MKTIFYFQVRLGGSTLAWEKIKPIQLAFLGKDGARTFGKELANTGLEVRITDNAQLLQGTYFQSRFKNLSVGNKIKGHASDTIETVYAILNNPKRKAEGEMLKQLKQTLTH